MATKKTNSRNGPRVRAIPGFPGYRASAEGEIQSCWKTHGGNARRGEGPTSFRSDRWRELKPDMERHTGRLRVRVKNSEGVYRKTQIARLVYLAFSGEIPSGSCVLHVDGDQGNNAPGNLQLGTALEVQRNRRGLGHHGDSRGEDHPNAKLTAEEVKAIRRLHRSGVKGNELAEQYGITKANVSIIVLGKSWTRRTA